MSRFIEHLRSFDRKERFAVLRDALGIHPETPCLNEDFRTRLASCIQVDVPKRVFLATDYHLDWIELALHRTQNPDLQPGKHFTNPAPDRINENQQDSDLLVGLRGRPRGPASDVPRADRGQGLPVLGQLSVEAQGQASREDLRRQWQLLRGRRASVRADDGTRAEEYPHWVLAGMDAERQRSVPVEIRSARPHRGDAPLGRRKALSRRLSPVAPPHAAAKRTIRSAAVIAPVSAY